MKEKQNKNIRRKVNTGSRKTKTSKIFSWLKFQHGSISPQQSNPPTDSHYKLEQNMKNYLSILNIKENRDLEGN